MTYLGIIAGFAIAAVCILVGYAVNMLWQWWRAR
jgi:hypothetical protein